MYPILKALLMLYRLGSADLGDWSVFRCVLSCSSNVTINKLDLASASTNGATRPLRRRSREVYGNSIYIIWFRFRYSIIVKVPRLGDSEGTFRSSSQAATCFYQSNHSKVEAIPLSAISTLTLLNAERQA